MNNPDDPQTWIAKAENDLLNIRNNLSAPQVPWDTICFHAQQAAEKLLKAFVVSRGVAHVFRRGSRLQFVNDKAMSLVIQALKNRLPQARRIWATQRNSGEHRRGE